MVKGTAKSTVVRKKGRPTLDIKKGILSELKSSNYPLSTSDLASRLNRAWHTIDRACLSLQIDGSVDGFKAGKMNLWRLNEKS